MPVNSGEVPVIAVASGKGGVGKTTVAVNLALALAASGLRTAADADQGKPVMLTRAVPEQVTAFELLAGRVREQLAQPEPPGRAAGG